MDVTTRKYADKGTLIDGPVPSVLDGFVPLLRRTPGFKGYFATVRMYEGLGPKEEVLPLMREHLFLMLIGAPGFRGYYTFLDEREATHGVSVSLFATREHAMEANQRVLATMRDRQIAPNPPSIMARPTAIVAAA